MANIDIALDWCPAGVIERVPSTSACYETPCSRLTTSSLTIASSDVVAVSSVPAPAAVRSCALTRYDRILKNSDTNLFCIRFRIARVNNGKCRGTVRGTKHPPKTKPEKFASRLEHCNRRLFHTNVVGTFAETEVPQLLVVLAGNSQQTLRSHKLAVANTAVQRRTS